MNEIITVNYDSEQPTVLGRDFTRGFGSKDSLQGLVSKNVQYGFYRGFRFLTRSKLRVQTEEKRF